MNQTLWNKLYESQSFTIKAIALLPYFFVFMKTYLFLKGSQNWSKERIGRYQTRKLRELINHAYRNVPYYIRLFDDNRIKPEDIKTQSDLQKIPFLTKELIRENFEDLKAKNFREASFEYVTTGGSTGIPLGFYYEKGKSRAIEWAFMKTQWDRVGYKFFNKTVILRGAIIPSASKGIFWQHSFFRRWFVLSSYHMTDENLPQYIEKIRTFKPKFFHAFPSSITLLAQFMKRNKVPSFPTLKAVLCGSENLYPWQRDLIQKTLNCRVYSWYGNSEQTVLAGECEYNSSYHIFPEYGIVELIDKNGNLVKKSDEMGEIVTTGLNNFAYPLIRYKTMDLGTFSDEECKCGRKYKLIKNIEGRLQEFIVTKTGRLISMTAINMHSDVFDHVKQFQFYQDNPGEVMLNIIKCASYSEIDTKYIHEELLKKMGNDVNLTLKFVDNIPQTRQGKHRFLIQNLRTNPWSD
jgi:phenylacetate-CoA ligase